MVKLSRLASAALLASAVGFAAPSSGCAGAEDPRENACAPGRPCQVNLTFLHTSDIHSRLLPFDQLITQVDATLGLGALNRVSNVGGVARLAYLVGRERARADRVLHLDSGDCFQGAPIFNFFQGEPEVRSLSALGVDAAVIGNHEFDYGATNVFRQFQRWGNFQSLAANYMWETQELPSNGIVGAISRPFTVFNTGGIKVGVIGMANLSSLTSVFDAPNRLGVTPLNTVEVAQFYIDLLRPHVDVVAAVTHLGLDVDQRMVRGTTGLDVVLGGHNHVVINPPQEIRDCSSDPQNPGFVWTPDPNLEIDPNGTPPNDALHPDPVNHPWMFKRACTPRRVIIAHSGAFSKYLGRLDLVLSNDAALVSPTGNPADYDPVNGFEVLTSRYTAFPVDNQVPEDPILVEMLQPYRRALDVAADLDLLIGYSPQGSRRISPTGGDSPLGNMVATAMWLRLGIQTDFSMTNSTGTRADINPGPVTLEQMYNVFPFDNSVSKMQLSGREVKELFDFSARRASARGCTTQVQIAGARIRLNCTGCESQTDVACQTDAQCAQVRGECDQTTKLCRVRACAEQIYIGYLDKPCACDENCAEGTPACGTPDVGRPGQCDVTGGPGKGRCLAPISETNRYELATSTYLAGGGSGFRVLQRNTTQFDTKIQQRDALIDYLRQGRACGYDANAGTEEGLRACSSDAECGDPNFVCACPGASRENGNACVSSAACSPSNGRCVRKDCRDQVADFHRIRCATNPDQDACRVLLNACELAGEECKILPCIDQTAGSFSDGRVQVIGR